MQASNQIKHFTCQLHPSEVIQRVCLESDTESSLRCIECILNGTEKVSKDSMIGLNEFIDNAARQYQTFRRTSAFENAPPEELTSFLAHEEENIQKLSHHVEQEKLRVNVSFNAMIQEFTQLCYKRKNEVVTQLDKQLATLKFNYSYYKSKLDRYYNKDKGDELNPDKDTLISRINQCEDTNQVEVLVKNIKDDLLEALSRENFEQKIHQIKESFTNLAQTLQDQAKSLPSTKFSDQTAIDVSLSEFREAADALLQDFVEVDNQISELSFTNFLSIDSKLIKKQEDLNLLKKWLAPSQKDFQLKLLYRGSRDGMSYEAFHKRCDNHPKTLIIAKSNHGKVFGGYTDQKWNNTSNYKASNDSWLFSIDEKLKFPLMPLGSQNAIYTHINYGPTFGSGHDLYIYLPPKDSGEYSDGGTQSYSQLGNAYQMNYSSNQTKKKANNIYGGGEESQTILAGSYQFSVEELEIYAVESRNKSRSNSDKTEFDSEIINPKQDLNLIKSWLGRGKKHELELIYRGSRDGFTAEDFHQACDNMGPTLVVCKSKAFDKVFGGFTSKNWSKDELYVEDAEAFLFSLTHSTKHPIVNKDYAIYGSGSCGPVFGAGHDLYICSESDTVEESTSSLGGSYQASDSIEEKTSYLAGGMYFGVDEIEVFTVKSS